MNAKNSDENFDIPDLTFWNAQEYSPLLNHQSLKKNIKKDPWQYQLNPMLDGFLNNIKGLKQTLKFKVSGKILDSSAYVLKRKTNCIIDYSLETQDDIEEAQILESENIQDDLMAFEGETIDEGFDEYDEDMELFKAFNELEENDYLSQAELEAIQEEKIHYLLNLEAEELSNRLEKASKLVEPAPKPIYKKVGLNELADALNDVLKSRDNAKQLKTPKRKIEKEKIPLLPERLIENGEKKRAIFEERVKNFHEDLIQNYEKKKEPILFLNMVEEATKERLVETVLIILHLINQQKIELWTSVEDHDREGGKDDGRNIFISPKE